MNVQRGDREFDLEIFPNIRNEKDRDLNISSIKDSQHLDGTLLVLKQKNEDAFQKYSQKKVNDIYQIKCVDKVAEPYHLRKIRSISPSIVMKRNSKICKLMQVNSQYNKRRNYAPNFRYLNHESKLKN